MKQMPETSSEAPWWLPLVTQEVWQSKDFNPGLLNAFSIHSSSFQYAWCRNFLDVWARPTSLPGQDDWLQWSYSKDDCITHTPPSLTQGAQERTRGNVRSLSLVTEANPFFLLYQWHLLLFSPPSFPCSWKYLGYFVCMRRLHLKHQ